MVLLVINHVACAVYNRVVVIYTIYTPLSANIYAHLPNAITHGRKVVPRAHICPKQQQHSPSVSLASHTRLYKSHTHTQTDTYQSVREIGKLYYVFIL